MRFMAVFRDIINKLSGGISFCALVLFFCLALSGAHDLYMSQLYHDLASGLELEGTDCMALSHNLRKQAELVWTKDVFNADLLSFVKESSATDKVYGFDISGGVCNDSEVNVMTAYPETYELYSELPISGSWFKAEDNSENLPQAVICGAAFSDVQPGDVIRVTATGGEYKYNSQRQTEYIERTYGFMYVKVSGKLSFPYIVPDPSVRPGSTPPYISSISSPVIFLLHDEKTTAVLKDKGFEMTPADSFVYFSYSTSANEVVKEHFRTEISELMPSTDVGVQYAAVQPTDDFFTAPGKDSTSFTASALSDPRVMSFVSLCPIAVTLYILLFIKRNSYIQDDMTRSMTTLPRILLRIAVFTASSAASALIIMLTRIICEHDRIDFLPNLTQLGDALGSELILSITGLLLLFIPITTVAGCIIPVIKFLSSRRRIPPPADNTALEAAQYYQSMITDETTGNINYSFPKREDTDDSYGKRY